MSFDLIILKVEKWDRAKHSKINLVPCYGGWERIRNLPLHLWHLKTFKAIGECLGGSIEYVVPNSLLIDCVKVGIKFSNNYCGFIPTEIEVIEGEEEYKAQVVTF